MFIHPRKNFERRSEVAEEAPACARAQGRDVSGGRRIATTDYAPSACATMSSKEATFIYHL
jgi:hypothetical protein